jgi:hypothetical protein
MAPDYNTLRTHGHILGASSEKISAAWRFIAEIVAYGVEKVITKRGCHEKSWIDAVFVYSRSTLTPAYWATNSIKQKESR